MGLSLPMTYSIVKALHIIAFTCWFAGLFYVVRLFIYNTEALRRGTAHDDAFHEQFNTMQHRLWYGITWPAMVATLIFGTWLATLYGVLLPWLHLKLTLIALLVAYHLLLERIHRSLVQGKPRYSSNTLRAINEVATLFLVGIVFTAVLKDALTLALAAKIFGVFTALLFIGFFAYKWYRRSKSAQ